MMNKKTLGLYLHIPFCVSKCDYCDFLSAPARTEIKEAYVRALIGEMEARSAAFRDYRVKTLFLGGGTPSILPEGLTEEILSHAHRYFYVEADAEITTEANPGTFSGDKLRAYRAMGINRLSIGLQSAHDRELRALGRIHTYAQFLEGYREARRAGFDNINIDLMSALPGQTATDWEDTLNTVIALEPEHISAYSLIIEEGTPFYDRYSGEGEKYLPGEEEERKMYYRTGELLAAAGYRRYEISNYAKPGRECRHNIGYWTGAEYLGLGLGASSLTGGFRFHNTEELEDYLENSREPEKIERERHEQTRKDSMEEFMFLGLRLMEGVRRSEFKKRFGRSIDEVYGAVIDRWIQRGMITGRGDHIALTGPGIDVSNVVLADFLLDEDA